MTPLPPIFLGAPLAHRGLHDPVQARPENSCAAIRAAVEYGYGIEIDLQPSVDGVAMVFHDERLDRLTEETGPIAARTAAELRAISLRGGNETIPTLAEVLELVSGRAALLLEIKDQNGQLGPTDGALEAAVSRAVAGYQGPLAVMSFNPHSVVRMAALCPGIARGLTTCAYEPEEWSWVPERRRAELRAMTALDEAQAAFVSHEAADLASGRLDPARSSGAAVLCWTIQSHSEETAARHHADNITFEGYLPDLALR